MKPFKVWKRRLSVRDLKDKFKRPMFRNMDVLAESDVMFLYKNIQTKLDNFVKVQKDVNRLGTIGNIDDIKGIISSFDQNLENKKKNGEENEEEDIYSDKKSSIQEEEMEEEMEGEGEMEEEEDEYEHEQWEEPAEEVYKPKIKKKKKKKKKNKGKSKENNQSNIPDNSNYKTMEYDPNLEKIYGVKTNNFMNKYAPYMSSTQKVKAQPPGSSNNINYQEEVRPRGYNTFSHKSKTYENVAQHMPPQEESDFDEEYEQDSMEEEEYDDSQQDMESINDSDVSDISNPYNINMKNVRLSRQATLSDEETSIQGRNKGRNGNPNLKESDLGAYYSSIAQGN
jgi:hypothetical protein